MRTGGGTEWFLWLKGDLMAWKYYNSEFPAMKNVDSIIKPYATEFKNFIEEPAFSVEDSTCLYFFKGGKWNQYGQSNALINKDFAMLSWRPIDYKNWAESYYDCDLDLEAIQSVFNNQLDDSIIGKLKVDLSLGDLREDIEEIGFEIEI